MINDARHETLLHAVQNERDNRAFLGSDLDAMARIKFEVLKQPQARFALRVT